MQFVMNRAVLCQVSLDSVVGNFNLTYINMIIGSYVSLFLYYVFTFYM